LKNKCGWNVAPFTGAWIETWSTLTINKPLKSRPSRARGLKHRINRPNHEEIYVAPFTGAWIETQMQ